MTEVAERGAFGTKKLVLGFDAGCMTCSDLAHKIEEEVGDKLEVRSLYDPQMVHWREQALGEDAPWAPTLVKVEGVEVKAWTGLGMGAVLSRRLGPVGTWRVMQVLGEMKSVSKTGTAPGAGLSRGQFLKGIGGAAAAVSILAGIGGLTSVAEAAEKPRLSTGTPALRKKAKAIVRASKEFKELAREAGQNFNFSNAKFVFNKESGVVSVILPTRGIESGNGIVATLLVDLQDRTISYSSHVVSALDNKGRYKVTAYENGESMGRMIVADNYMITPDGRKLSHEQVKREARGLRNTSAREQEEASFALQGRCTRCRRNRRNRCNYIIWGSCLVYGRIVPWLGAACGFLSVYSGNKGAGCAAWARSTCYKDGYCG